jgi:L-asparaginase
VVQNAQSKLDRYLRQLRLPDLHVEITPLMNIDSLEMTDGNRAHILDIARFKLQPGEPVLITHGTDTMVETGLYLKRGLPSIPAPVVMTGAMTPLGFEGSDGLQNLTESLMATRLLAPGVFIVMHNQVFPIDNVRKDRQSSRFVLLHS